MLFGIIFKVGAKFHAFGLTEKNLTAINMASNNNIKENCCATTLNWQLRKRFSGLKKYVKLLDKTIYGF